MVSTMNLVYHDILKWKNIIGENQYHTSLVHHLYVPTLACYHCYPLLTCCLQVYYKLLFWSLWHSLLSPLPAVSSPVSKMQACEYVPLAWLSGSPSPYHTSYLASVASICSPGSTSVQHVGSVPHLTI